MPREFETPGKERLSESSLLEKKIREAEHINLLAQQNRWDEAIKFLCSDNERLEKARKVVSKDFLDFSREGDKLIGSRYVQEAREVSQANFDVAIDVEQGEISREAALIISKLYGGKFSEDQIYQMASFFVARNEEEDLDSFNVRRRSELDEFNIDGADLSVVAKVKKEILDILEIYHNLELGSTKSCRDWPIRGDGQIRRSFINRSELIDVSLIAHQEAVASVDNLGNRINEIKKSFEIPDSIRSFDEILKIPELGEKIKYVSFDMYDTLSEWTSNLEERHKLMIDSAVNILKKEGIEVSNDEFTKIRKRIWYGKYKDKLYPMQEFKASDAISDIVDEIFQKRKISIDPERKTGITNAIEDAFIRVDIDTSVATPEIKSTLKSLKDKNVKVVVISNHPYKKESIELLLKKHGLMKYIDQVFISSETGCRKSKEDPQAKIFNHVLNKVGISAEQMIHIGDNWEADSEAPNKAGIKGIQFANPEATHRKIQGKNLNISGIEYKNQCLSSQVDYLNRLSSEYFNRNRKDHTPNELEIYGRRLYEMSRDYYAPLLIKFSEHCLEKLKKNDKALNLCTGRDSLAMYFMQRKMIDSFPEEFDQSLKKRLKYLPVSRSTINNSDQALLKKFLSNYGVDESQAINIIDNGIEGTTQNRLSSFYPDKKIEGEYLQSVVFDDDPNKNRKKGFIYQLKGIRKYDSGGHETKRSFYDITGDQPKEILHTFTAGDFIHVQEDLWNGIFSSPGVLIDKNGRIVPIDRNKKITFMPGNTDILPGLSENENYILMKKMAMKGILDGMKIYKRKKQLGIEVTKEQSILELAAWFNSNNKKNGIDKTILDGLARKRD